MAKTKDERLADDPMLVWLEQDDEGHSSLEFLRHNLRERFTVSTRDICKVFRCRRTWVSDSIRPNVPHTYVPQQAIWAVQRSAESNDLSSTWYDREAVIDLFKRYATVQASAKLVYMRDVVEEQEVFDKQAMRIRNDRKIYLRDKPGMMYTTLMMFEDEKVNWVLEHSIKDAKKVPWTDIEVDDSFWEDVVDNQVLRVSGDLLDYGDTEQDLQMQLLRRCAVRVSLSVPGKDGVVPKKPRLLYKLQDEPEGLLDVDYFLLPYGLDTSCLED